MKTQAIVPARITFEDGVPFAPAFGDVYHARAGALAQAQHVFLRGNGLPGRWRGRREFVVLETGFGLGNNFLATWHAWRGDPTRCQRLVFVSVEKHPLRRNDLAMVHRHHPWPQLAGELVARWPVLTPNVHRLEFESGRVVLLLALGDVQEVLPALDAEVDAFFLDGFAPARNQQMWSGTVYQQLARLSAPGATAATWSVARAVREGLTDAGFEVQTAPGFGGKREMTVARHAPRHRPTRAPALAPAEAARREAAIVGGGLAGAAVAAALAARGWACTVLDRHPRPAQEASGNPGGLYRGIVNRHDGPHARLHRSAALHLAALIESRRAELVGGFDGLLRLEDPGRGDVVAALTGMRALVDALGLPPEFVQPLDPEQASAAAGTPLRAPAWFFPAGGWVRPASLVSHWLAAPGVRWQGSSPVQGLEAGARGWRLRGEHGQVLAESPVVVLANACDAQRLAPPGGWQLRPVRGQITGVPAGTPGLIAPRLPLASAGYVLPAHEGWVWCGATTQPDDADARVRAEDHQHNLEQLSRLLGSPASLLPQTLRGRVGWRAVTPDRLPLVGPAPDAHAATAARQRLTQPRQVPRLPGLYLYTGLGSRGITWSALCAEVLAAWIDGSPPPLETDLRDALDPARFLSRAARRTGL